MSDLTKENQVGSIKISDNVAAAIANIAASEVEGVVKVVGSSTSPISDLFGKKNYAKGVKVSMEEEGTVVELSLSIIHGVNIVALCENVQNKVKEAVESMTGITVKEINISVSDIIVQKEKKEDDQEDA